MNKYVLKAEKRILTGKKTKKLRRDGIIPGNVFGKSIDSCAVQFSSVEFNRVYKDSGETSLIWLSVDGETKERPTLVKSMSFSPVSGDILHVDLHQVNLKEKVSAWIPVEIVGESETVKQGQAALDTQLKEIEVEALPTDLPESIIFDISELKEIGDHLKVSDVKLPSGVELLSDPESLVVSLSALQKEEEPLETVATEAEVVGEEKKEGESAPEEKTQE